MRSIWKGAISFGLVTIPVKLYGATEERDVSFHQVRRGDGSRIRYKRVAQADGEEVAYGDIAKGYELPGGETVVLTDEDFKDLPLTTSRTIDVLEFVPLSQIDPVYYAKSYYLEPEKAGTKPYVLLRDALESSGKVGLVKVALRQRESLAALRVRDGVFVLETMLWPDEVRAPDFPFLAEQVEVRPQELTMAQSLIDTLSADFHPEAYSDSYREALEALIEAKIAGRQVVAPTGQADSGGAVLDLMAALRASVAAAQGGKTAATGSGSGSDSDSAAPADGAAASMPRKRPPPKGAGDAAADAPPAKPTTAARRARAKAPAEAPAQAPVKAPIKAPAKARKSA